VRVRYALLRGLATELAWTGAHLVTYPLGIVRERARPARQPFGLAGLGPLRRGRLEADVAAAGIPVLLVHGVADNRSVFALLRRGLERRGVGPVYSLNYPVYTRDLRTAAARVAAEVEALAAESGHDRVHIVGHSLGGLIARYYVQCLGGDDRVDTLVTLGTPHAGTRLARLAPGGVLRQLSPGSEVLDELAAPAPGCRTRFVAFWAEFDEMVHPASAARLEHPDLNVVNIQVRGVGHLALPVAGQVIHEVTLALAGAPADEPATGYSFSTGA
jgi:triacylglycerol lipase